MTGAGGPPSDRPPSDRERRRRFERERRAQLARGVRLQADAAAEVLDQLRRAETEIRAALAGTPTDFEAWRLRQLQDAVRRAIAQAEAGVARTIDGGVVDAWRAGIDLVDRPLAAAGLDALGDLVSIDTRVLDAMRSFLTDRIRDLSAALVNQANGELAQAMIGTRTPWQAATRISAVISEGGMKRALVIVRTEMGRAYAVAAQARMVQASARLPGLRKQWRRSGKLRARFEHQAIDGQVRRPDEPFDLHNGVKLMHPRDPAAPPRETVNCGCTSIPFMASWQVRDPGRRPVTDDEAARSRQLRLLQDADLREAADAGF